MILKKIISSWIVLFFIFVISLFPPASFGLADTGKIQQVFQIPLTEENSKVFWEIADLLSQNKEFQAVFKQTKHITVLKNPLVSSGTLIFSAGKELCWQTEKPFVSTLSITPKGIFKKERETGFKEVLPERHIAANNLTNVFLAVFGGDKKSLQDNFDLFLEGLVDNWTIGLKPRGRVMKHIIEAIVLKGDSVLKELLVLEANGDYSMISLSALEFDTTAFTGQRKECFEL